jgi:sugar/nucleoside kinase (ribokinase family)
VSTERGVSKVGCAGILVEDTFCGPIAAMPPEGALQLLDDMPRKAGGCAANVAIDLAKQGLSTDVAGCVGRDSGASLVVGVLESHGVGCAAVVPIDIYPTSRTVILLIEGQDRRYLHVPGANRAFTTEYLSRDWLSGLRIFYLGGLFALPGINLQRLADVLSFCRSKGVMTVVDVVTPQDVRGMADLQPLLPLIDVFLPNEDEARAFTGVTDAFDQLKRFVTAGANTVIITRGASGCLAARERMVWSCGTYQMNVVDPSGSGDAFTSGVIRSLLQGWDMPRTLRYASAIGASATRAPGTTDAVFSASDAESFIATHSLTVTERAVQWM